MLRKILQTVRKMDAKLRVLFVNDTPGLKCETPGLISHAAKLRALSLNQVFSVDFQCICETPGLICK